GWTLLSNPINLSSSRGRRLATIGWFKGMPSGGSTKVSKLMDSVKRWLAFRCDALIAYGRLSKDYFTALGFPEERIFVAQNTVDTIRIAADRDNAKRRSDELRRELRLPDKPVVGFLGQIADFKKPLQIVEAFEQARGAGMDAALLIAGKGPGREALETKISDSPHSQDIFYVPEVPAGAEGGYFQLFDLYATFAAGGLGILEAMAHGRAVLSTPERYPETELLEDEVTALLSNDFSVESFARRMRAAIESRPHREAIGREAERVVLAKASQEGMVQSIDAAVDCAKRHAAGANHG
ncbi:MAG: glycosyltransferase family 4 protein, partial [Planctomycetales bacterium]|nr:glycosyltransferase family 4 protein [Planctomycetales bacterium]